MAISCSHFNSKLKATSCIFCILLLLIIFTCTGYGQIAKIDSTSTQTVYGFQFHTGFIFAHSIYVQNTKGAQPTGFEMEYAKLNTGEGVFKQYKCAAKTGWLFSYTNLDKDFLGSSYSAAYFLEPVYRLSSTLSMHVKGAMGLSYLTNPYDSVTNKENQTFSLPVNFFLQLGLGLEYTLGNHLTLNGSANFFHNSNGGFSQPNRGLNYPNISLGVNYYTHTNKLPHRQRLKDSSWKHQSINWDAGILYSPKSGYNSAWKAERKFLGGAMLQASKQVSPMDNITLAAEIFYDGAMQSIKNNLNDPSSSTRAGMMIGHEFLFNKFIFSQQLGYYVFKQTDYYNRVYNDDYRNLYHRWSLRYALTPRLYAGFSLLAHAQVADFIDLRIQYRL